MAEPCSSGARNGIPTGSSSTPILARPPYSRRALSVANVVIAPCPLRTLDLDATEQLVHEMPDYPVVIVPNMVPRIPSAAEINRLSRIVERALPCRSAPDP